MLDGREVASPNVFVPPETFAAICAAFDRDEAGRIGGIAARIDGMQHSPPRGLLWWYYRLQAGYAHTTYGGKLFCLNEDGVTFVIKPGPKFEILHTNQLAEDDMGMATPVIVGSKLIVRTAPRIYCISSSDSAAK